MTIVVSHLLNFARLVVLPACRPAVYPAVYGSLEDQMSQIVPD